VAGDFELSPKLLFFCSSGRIGVIIDVGKALSLRLSALQRNMAAVIKGPGGTNHTW
jgi:DNA damage-binding protein 1